MEYFKKWFLNLRLKVNFLCGNYIGKFDCREANEARAQKGNHRSKSVHPADDFGSRKNSFPAGVSSGESTGGAPDDWLNESRRAQSSCLRPIVFVLPGCASCPG